MMQNHLYMAVTADRYELPISVRDTAEELGQTMGYTTASVYTALSRPKTGELRGFNIVKIADDERVLLNSAARGLAKSTGLTVNEVQRAAKEAPQVKSRNEMEAYLHCWKLAHMTPPKGVDSAHCPNVHCKYSQGLPCVGPVCWRDMFGGRGRRREEKQ